MASNGTPTDEIGPDGHGQQGQGESAAGLSTDDDPSANREHAQTDWNQSQTFQGSQYEPATAACSPEKKTPPAGLNPLNEGDSESKPPAQLMQTGGDFGVAAPDIAASLEPTPLPPTRSGFENNSIGQGLGDSTNESAAQSLGAFQQLTDSLSGMNALNQGATLQPQVPVSLGWTGLVAQPQVGLGSTQAPLHQQPTPLQSPFSAADPNGSQNHQNEIALQQQQQQQNLALLQLLQHHTLMHSQGIGTQPTFPPPASLASLSAHSANPLPQVSASGPPPAASAPPMPRDRTSNDAANDDAAASSSRLSAVIAPSVAKTAKVNAERQDDKSRPAGATYTGKKKPKRALTAYNIFFKEERVRLLEDVDDQTGGEGSGGAIDSETIRKTKRQRRRKGTSRKIGFEEMGKIIGKKWKQIDPQSRSYYDKQAAEDKKRFKLELEIYNKRQIRLIEAELQRQEATVSEETRRIYLETGGKSQTKK